METNLLGMTASTKQRNAYSNVTIGLAWMLTLLPTSKHATGVKFAELTTTLRQLYFPACPNLQNLTKGYTPIFLDPSKRLTMAKSLFCA
jgi:hypothetical protein